MNRQFSVIRRRPQVIDILTPFVYGTTEYRIKWAENFDDVFATLMAPGAIGYVDPAINLLAQATTFNNNAVRIIFDPTDAAWSITDPNKAFWLQLARYDGAVETYVSPPTLLLPDTSNHGVGIVTIQGTAPIGATVADSLQLDLPHLMSDFQVRNEGAVALRLATEPGGSEFELAVSAIPQYTIFNATQGSLLVRGVSAPTLFSATFTLAFPR